MDSIEEKFTNNLNFTSEKIPISHEVILEGHTRWVKNLIIDKGNARLVSGGNDY